MWRYRVQWGRHASRPRLNVVNVDLLLGGAEDEHEGGGLREVTELYKPPLLQRFVFNKHTGGFLLQMH